MNPKLEKILVALSLSALSLTAFGSDQHCTDEPRANWQTREQVRASLEKQGYTVKRIKTEDTCYEAKATGKDGRRVELIVNPVDGKFQEEANHER